MLAKTFQCDENAEGGSSSLQKLPANSLAEDLAASEELNGDDSQYEEKTHDANGNTVEEKRNIKTKFFMKYKLFDSICYLIF